MKQQNITAKIMPIKLAIPRAINNGVINSELRLVNFNTFSEHS